MVALKALTISLLFGLVAANECPALSHTFLKKPKNLFDLTTVDCRVGIQAAECAINVRPSYGQTWGAFRINHNKDCNHGAPYGDCCLFAGAAPASEDLEDNPSVLLFFWDSDKTGAVSGPGTGCIQNPTNGCCGRQDQDKFTTTAGCPYPAGDLYDQYGRVGDGCPPQPGDQKPDQQSGQTTTTTTPDPPTTKDNPPPSGFSPTSQDPSLNIPAIRRRFVEVFRRWAQADTLPTTQTSSSKKQKGGSSSSGDQWSGDSGKPPLCGPKGKFPNPPLKCNNDPKAPCKPGVKNKRPTNNAFGDVDGTTCPKPGQAQGVLTASQPNTQGDIQPNTQPVVRKRMAGSGGNQFDPHNSGQLNPVGKCCWCHKEKQKMLAA